MFSKSYLIHLDKTKRGEKNMKMYPYRPLDGLKNRMTKIGIAAAGIIAAAESGSAAAANVDNGTSLINAGITTLSTSPVSWFVEIAAVAAGIFVAVKLIRRLKN